nr:TetR/AcrR family transcriptional regulator [Zhongshania aquimaris]
MEAARTVLASGGPEALSLSRVANLAGINRGTAYQHFGTRDELVKASIASVGEYLSSIVFSGIEVDDEGQWIGNSERPVVEVVSRLVNFAVDNPALCRIWLFEVLSSANPSQDPFFRQFKASTKELAKTKSSKPGIDVEVLSVLMLSGYFVWPLWVEAHADSKRDRQEMARRMRHEVVRLFLHGVLENEEFPQLQDMLDKNLI